VTADALATARRHKARAEAALEIGRYSHAERDARAALAAVPSDVDATLYLTRALLGQSRHEDAVATARAAVEIAPNDGYTHYLLGFALQVAGRHAEAIQPLREAVSLQPSAPRYHARLAIALCESGAKEQSRAVIDAVAAKAEDDVMLVDECARVYSALGEHDVGVRFAQRGVTLRPADPSTHWRLAWVLANRRDYNGSAVASTAALELEPNYWAAWEELGYALNELQRRSDPSRATEAEAALSEALRLKPGLRSAAFNLATLYRSQGRLVRAERVCDDALAIDPKHEQLARIRDGLRDQRLSREKTRREQSVLLLVTVVMGLVSAAITSNFLSVAASMLVAGLALIGFFVARQQRDPADDGPAPVPALLARRARQTGPVTHA
jgi:tetratricopeptide (TPR) repeat protein